MNFDVIKASTHISKWQGSDGSVAMRFDVVPKDREYLEIGDRHILSASGYLPMRQKDRQPISASVSILTNAGHLSHIGGKKPICGYAEFFSERRGRLDSDPAELAISVVVEPHVFEQMLHLRTAEPGAATLHVDVEGLEFGWEPDGSHTVWNLKDDSDCGHPKRRRVTSFSYSVATFWTTEGAIRQSGERRLNAELAESLDPEDRKLAANLQLPEKADPLPHLLRQCRALLLAIFALGIFTLVSLSR